MPFAKLKETTTYYEVIGQGQPVVLINGLKADHINWALIVNELMSDYQLILLDNRGTGQTLYDENTSFSVEEMAKDIHNLLDYLKINSAYIVGHSLGGAIAQSFAYQFPEKVKKLFLFNTFEHFNDFSKNLFHETLKLHEQNARPGEIINQFLPFAFPKDYLTKKFVDLVITTSNEYPYAQSMIGYKHQYQVLTKFNSTNLSNKIKVPTIVVGSLQDQICPYEESVSLAKKIPDCILMTLTGGHASNVEEPKLFASIIKNYTI